MKPFTEYLNDKLVEASQNVLSRSTDNAKAVRAAKREAELLKTREKSLADKRKRAGLTGGKTLKFVEEKTVKIIATADHGAIRKGQTFITTAKTNNMGQTRLVIKDEDMPRMTMGPTLFLDKDGKPNDGGAWSRFAIVEASMAPSDQLAALSTVMRSMGANNQDINDVRDELKSEDRSTSAIFLLLLADTIGNDITAFNAFVKARK